ncbi:MAG: hypothetical protein QM711_12485 [Micropruina sp.]|uniref:hypothetical protein n=1 Tax=Micropruina sp. TaxID=2737536 RepID=UPI0039E6E702
MMITRRSLLQAGAFTAATLPFVGRARAQSDELTIGYIPDFPNGSVLAIAKDQKLWEAEGLTPNIKVFTNGPLQIQAMGAGSLNFAEVGAKHYLRWRVRMTGEGSRSHRTAEQHVFTTGAGPIETIDLLCSGFQSE